MLPEQYPYYLAGSPEHSGEVLAVTDKYTDEVVTHVALAGREAIEQSDRLRRPCSTRDDAVPRPRAA